MVPHTRYWFTLTRHVPVIVTRLVPCRLLVPFAMEESIFGNLNTLYYIYLFYITYWTTPFETCKLSKRHIWLYSFPNAYQQKITYVPNLHLPTFALQTHVQYILASKVHEDEQVPSVYISGASQVTLLHLFRTLKFPVLWAPQPEIKLLGNGVFWSPLEPTKDNRLSKLDCWQIYRYECQLCAFQYHWLSNLTKEEMDTMLNFH